MRKLCVFAILLFSVEARAQKNDLGLFALYNNNGGSFIALNSQHGTPVAVTYNSSMGGAAEYRHWFTPRLGVGVWFEGNPSFGVLFTSSANPYLYGSALTRYEFALPVTFKLWTKHKVQPFFEAGPGWIVTHGAQPGWSENIAVVTGGGVDWYFRPNWAVEVAETALNAKQGCYGDPTCSAAWAIAQDSHAGMAYGW